MIRSRSIPVFSAVTRPRWAAVGCLALLAGSTGWAARASAGQLKITVIDRDTRKPIACRMHLTNAAGRPQKAGRAPFWHDHFVFSGKIALKLPVGDYTFELERGLEYVVRGGKFRIDNFADDSKEVDMQRFVDMSTHGWWSGDLDVRRPVRDVELLMEADDLHVAQVITWWNEKNQWAGRQPPEDPLVRFGDHRYYHLMAGGHSRAGTAVQCFHLPGPLEPAVRAGNDEYPPLVKQLLKARENPDLWVDVSKPYWWDLPMLVSAGQVDSIQLAHSHLCRKTVLSDEGDGKPRDRQRYPAPRGNARWSQEIYFRLLDCGLRIPPTAGSGSGLVPNPVGYNRVYVHVDGEFDYGRWWENLRRGRVVLTNGPLLRPAVHGQLPGHVFLAEKGQKLALEIGLTLSTRKPISYLELIKNGRIEHSIRFEDYASAGRLPKLHFDRSGWFLIRAVTDLPKTYRFAMTGPYYVQFDRQPRISRQAARFFLDWVYERARQIKLDDPARHREVLGYHRQARDFWQDVLSRANAE